MKDEELPLILNQCRICTDNIENPYQYCECKDDLFFHKECMEKWLTSSNTTNCDVCNKEFKIKKKINYTSNIISGIYFLIVSFFSIFLGYYFIKNILNKKNNKSKALLILFFIFFCFYMIYNCTHCVFNSIFKKKYKLFLTT